MPETLQDGASLCLQLERLGKVLILHHVGMANVTRLNGVNVRFGKQLRKHVNNI